VLLIHKEFPHVTRRLLAVAAQKHQRAFSMSSVIDGKWSAVVLITSAKEVLCFCHILLASCLSFYQQDYQESDG